MLCNEEDVEVEQGETNRRRVKFEEKKCSIMMES